jgi:excinuclease ABC subunit A
MDRLVVSGATQHNLKNVSVSLPRNELVVITGPSGSGKSSLAFDTIYAEGQRRYVESLSAYARQFLDQLPKPRVESIEGLSPAIAIEQKALGKSPRSTVGTVTEIADYLRLLFSRIGVPHCPISGEVIRAYTVQEIVDSILSREEGSRVVLLARIVRGRPGDLKDELSRLRRDGYVRARIDGQNVDLGEEPEIDPEKPHDLDVVVDRVAVREGIKGRVTDSVELCLKLGEGSVLIDAMDGSEPVVMSERLVSWKYGLTLPPLEPRLFSFNSPHGACPECNGLGRKASIDAARVVPDPTRSLREGAVTAFGRRGSEANAKEVQAVVAALGVDPDKPWEDLPKAKREIILHGDGKNYVGIIPRLMEMLDSGAMPEGDEGEEAEEGAEGSVGYDDLSRFVSLRPCTACDGTRLRKEALSVRLAGFNIGELCRMPLTRLRQELLSLTAENKLPARDAAVAAPLLPAVTDRLGFLIDVGLGYLSLDRAAATLSGGEGQRIRLATQIGASLVGVLYVLDEPSVGLHARDNRRLIAAMRRLVDKGNSVLVVEHDRDAILAADHVVDMGPRAGVHGGQIVAQGTPAEIMANEESITGPYLSYEKHLPLPARKKVQSKRALRIVGATGHNLKNVTVSIPLGVLTAVTGVSGSGKSSLIVDTLLAAARARLYGASGTIGPCEGIEGLEQIDKVISIDQAPIGRTPRSNPATYTGIFSDLREVFASLPDARARGYKPGRFSFNVKGGRCEACMGDGVLKVEMHFLPDVYVACDACGGSRYNRETLEIKYKGLSIADVLNLTVEDALPIFEPIGRIHERLRTLNQVGLGYVTLGQPATTLSGGEAQRIKLALELSRRATGNTLYVLDEPTTGLHFSDIEHLAQALLDLREAGNSILVIEHNLELVACADWVIDMGPEGGDGGGTVVAQGTPEDVAEVAESHTGQALKEILHELNRRGVTRPTRSRSPSIPPRPGSIPPAAGARGSRPPSIPPGQGSRPARAPSVPPPAGGRARAPSVPPAPGRGSRPSAPPPAGARGSRPSAPPPAGARGSRPSAPPPAGARSSRAQSAPQAAVSRPPSSAARPARAQSAPPTSERPPKSKKAPAS